MSKAYLIKRLKWYYPMEKFNAFVIFPMIAIGLLIYNSIQNIFFLIYGLLVCIYILHQGQKYWHLKLKRLTNIPFDQDANIQYFKNAKRNNIILIALMPLMFFLQWYQGHWSFNKDHLLLWAIFTNVFAILEHINYYYVQLSYDNTSDITYLKKHRKLKKASLAKDILEGEI